jgi:hypothetical protein
MMVKVSTERVRKCRKVFHRVKLLIQNAYKYKNDQSLTISNLVVLHQPCCHLQQTFLS